MTELLKRILGRNLNFAPDGDGSAPAATPGDNSTPSDGTTSEGGETESEGKEEGPNVRELLDFDPFEPTPSVGKEKTETKPKAEPKSTPSDAKEPKKNGDALPPSDSSKAPTPDPVQRALDGINEALRNGLQPQKVEPKAEPKSSAPKFAFDIPAPISKLLFSEDPEERAQGMSHALNGVANLVYQETMAEVSGVLQQLMQRIPQIVDSRTGEQKSQETASKDFFGRFTTLKQTPQMMAFIAGESKALAQEMHAAGHRNMSWNEDFREALGKRIFEGLGLPFPEKGQQQTQQPNGNSRQPKKATFQTGGGNRGNQPEVLGELAKDILETFN